MCLYIVGDKLCDFMARHIDICPGFDSYETKAYPRYVSLPNSWLGDAMVKSICFAFLLHLYLNAQ